MLLFWRNVKDILDFEGMTQKELASAINESYNTLQSWINRDRYPDAQQAVTLAKTLRTSVEFLVTGDSDIPKPNNSKTIELLQEAIGILSK